MPDPRSLSQGQPVHIPPDPAPPPGAAALGAAEGRFAEPPDWILAEEAALGRVLPALRALQAADASAESDYKARVRQAHADWTDALRETVQREALEEALEAETRHLAAHQAARKSRQLPLSTPYFARMELHEGPRRQELMLGKVGVVEKGLRIIDWRHAPVARLYYEYEEGDEYVEEIAGREREGLLACRRRLDIRDGVLVEAQRNAEVLRRTAGGAFLPPDEAERRTQRTDHRLPDIVSLITRDQFAVVAQPEAGVVLLRGRAGSGKTTVALHRVAWLHFQDPQRFHPSRVLIVMFNKALRTYIARVLPELGVPGVGADTFHAWAGRMLREGEIGARFAATPSAEASRLRRDPHMETILAAGLDGLADRLGAWAAEKIPGADAAWAACPGAGLAKLGRLLAPGGPELALGPLRRRMDDHVRDLQAILEDEDLLLRHLPAAAHPAVPALRQSAARHREDGTLAFEDAALLLRIGQMKAAALPGYRAPWAGRYAHVVIDEAQDLSTLEIAALVHAADAARSVTIAGDPAQKILADSGFEGFEALLSRLGGRGGAEIRLQALQVGHRSTRPIMALALEALGQSSQGDLAVAAARDGAPVDWLEAADEPALVRALAEALAAHRAARPQGLVAVLALRKGVADRWADLLAAAGVPDVRRADRGDFRFTPGVLVTNVHQVKGLEFDGVALIDPAAFGPRDRHLLHVALTRAAERLWVVMPSGPGALLEAARRAAREADGSSD